MTTFEEYKEKVSIAQVAEAIGFEFDKSKGKTQPTYTRGTEEQGNKEQIVIRNPNDLPNQHYFDRNYKGGDVINFIKEHLNEFSQFIQGQPKNDYVKINMVLSHFAEIPYTPKMETVQKAQEHKELDRSRYVEVAPTTSNLMYLTRERAIDPATVEKFLPHITLLQDTASKGNFTNVAFPYHKPGSDEVTNYEIRNHGFKGMAAGGDKEHSSWVATNAERNSAVKNVIFFESAIDAMSFYELKKGYYKLAETAFVSVGGYVSPNQVKNVIDQYPNARVSTAYDKDINGHLYDVLTYSIAIGKDVRVTKNDNTFNFKWDNKSIQIPQEELTLNRFKEESGLKHRFGTVFKATGDAKDFNEQLQHVKAEQKEQSQSQSKGIKV